MSFLYHIAVDDVEGFVIRLLQLGDVVEVLFEQTGGVLSYHVFAVFIQHGELLRRAEGERLFPGVLGGRGGEHRLPVFVLEAVTDVVYGIAVAVVVAVAEVFALDLHPLRLQHLDVAVIGKEHKAAHHREYAHRDKDEVHIPPGFHLVKRVEHRHKHDGGDDEDRAHAEGDGNVPAFVFYHTLYTNLPQLGHSHMPLAASLPFSLSESSIMQPPQPPLGV